MTFDTIIKGGTVVTGRHSEVADVGIKDGKIAAIGDLNSAEAGEVVDAKNLHVLPGVIDTQVHFREPGMTQKEDIESGTRSALAGGVTTVFEMPNTVPPTVTEEALNEKLNLAKGRSWCNIAFFVGASPENVGELPRLEVLPGTPGVKIFMGSSTGSLLVPDDEILLEVLKAGRYRCPVHAEDHNRIESRKSLREASPKAHAHPVWRDAEAAKIATIRMIRLAKQANRPVHILHISTADELPILAEAKASGQDVTCEVTPQHLWFTAPEAYDELGTLAQMNPPIRGHEHRAAIREALKNGLFDVFGSDHAPHTLAEKSGDYPDTPSGMPGVQTLLPALLNLIHTEGLISLNRLVQMASEVPAKLYGIKNKGFLEVGYDADITLVDLQARHRPTREQGSISTIQSKCGWSPFEKEVLTGWPLITFIGGQKAWEDGAPVGEPKGTTPEFERQTNG